MVEIQVVRFMKLIFYVSLSNSYRVRLPLDISHSFLTSTVGLPFPCITVIKVNIIAVLTGQYRKVEYQEIQVKRKDI